MERWKLLKHYKPMASECLDSRMDILAMQKRLHDDPVSKEMFLRELEFGMEILGKKELYLWEDIVKE